MTIPDHLITPLDWSAEALRHAAAWTGQPEGARALVESKRYLAMHEQAERLQAELSAANARTEQYMAERNVARLQAQREVGETLRKLREERDAARAELAQAREVPREVEWVSDNIPYATAGLPPLPALLGRSQGGPRARLRTVCRSDSTSCPRGER